MATAKTKQKADAGVASMQGVIAAGQEAMQTFMKAGADGYGKAFETVKLSAEEVAKGYDEFAATGKDNVDAVVTASTTYAKGMEAMASELLSFAKAAMEQNIANTRAVIAAKSVHDVMDLQAGFAKSNMDELLSQSTKLGEMAAKMTQDAIEPINARMAVTMNRLGSAA